MTQTFGAATYVFNRNTRFGENYLELRAVIIGEIFSRISILHIFGKIVSRYGGVLSRFVKLFRRKIFRKVKILFCKKTGKSGRMKIARKHTLEILENKFSENNSP